MQIAPYISDQKRKRKRRRAYLFTALGLVILYAIFFATQWLILRSPVFRVDHVVVQGNSAIASADVIALAEASALPSHSFFAAHSHSATCCCGRMPSRRKSFR
jgi:cell division septal protein FtsQ